MNQPKLWWYIPQSDGSFKYLFETYSDILDMDDFEELPTIVHPNNPRYPKEYRSYNREHFDVIYAYKIERIKKLIALDASDLILAMEIDHGMFSCADHVITCLVESPNIKNK